MGKPQVLVLLLLSLAAATRPFLDGSGEHKVGGGGGDYDSEWWMSQIRRAKEQKVTHIHFFFHDILSGPHPSAVPVAQSPQTSKSHTFFGLVTMMDDPLTAGPEAHSTVVGRAQGLYASAGLQEFGLLMVMNLVFTDGKYNGSTLAVLGRNAALTPVREMPILGGTGLFRFASGFATAKTHHINLTTGDAVVEYNVVAIHY